MFPPLMQYLFDEYGLKGAFLLCGGLLFNAAAGALLFRVPPGENFRRKAATSENKDNEDGKTLLNLEVYKSQVLNGAVSTDSDHELKGYSDAPADEARTQCPVVKSSQNQLFKELSDTANAVGARCHRREPASKTVKDGSAKGSLLSFFKLPKFYLVVITYVAGALTMTTYVTIVVDFAMDRDISKWDAVFLVTLYTVMDTVARFGSGWITDRGYLRRSSMLALHLFLMGGCMFLTSLSYSNYAFVALSLAIGWSHGTTLTLIPVSVMELVEPENFSIAYGVVSFIVGIPLLIRPSLIGKLHVVPLLDPPEKMQESWFRFMDMLEFETDDKNATLQESQTVLNTKEQPTPRPFCHPLRSPNTLPRMQAKKEKFLSAIRGKQYFFHHTFVIIFVLENSASVSRSESNFRSTGAVE